MSKNNLKISSLSLLEQVKKKKVMHRPCSQAQILVIFLARRAKLTS